MHTEKFVDEPTAKKATGRTFIGIAVVLAAMLLTFLLLWGYLVSTKLFVSIFSIIVLTFSIIMIVFVTTIRAKLSDRQYVFYLSTTSFMTFISLIMVIIFTILSVNIFRKKSNISNVDTDSSLSRNYDYTSSSNDYNDNVFSQKYSTPL